jgi:hypothetical protein
MGVAICYEFSVQLRDRVAASFPLFDELGEMGINAGGSRVGLLFRKRATPQPARNGSMTDPYLFSDGGLRETELTEGYHLLVLSQALLSFCLTRAATFFGSTFGDWGVGEARMGVALAVSV